MGPEPDAATASSSNISGGFPPSSFSQLLKMKDSAVCSKARQTAGSSSYSYLRMNTYSIYKIINVSHEVQMLPYTDALPWNARSWWKNKEHAASRTSVMISSRGELPLWPSSPFLDNVGSFDFPQGHPPQRRRRDCQYRLRHGLPHQVVLLPRGACVVQSRQPKSSVWIAVNIQFWLFFVPSCRGSCS